jgi:hypothetical protein
MTRALKSEKLSTRHSRRTEHSAYLAEKVLNSSAFFTQFGVGGIHLGAREVVDLEALHDLVFAVLAGARIAVDHARFDAVGAVRRNAHGHPFAFRRAEGPAAHVVDGGRGSRSSRGGAAGLDDGRAALLHVRDKGAGVPGIVDHRLGGCAFDGGVVDVRILGGRVVAPDDDVLDVGVVRAGLLGELAHRTVMVEADHGGEAFRIEVRCVLLGDEGVGVRRVADNEHFNIARGMIVDGLALRAEDAAVCGQEVLALHALLARHGADEEAEVCVLEGNVRIVGGDDVVQQREGAVFQLHDHAFKRAEGRGDFEQLQVDRLVRSKHVAGGDAEEEGVADLASGTSDHYSIKH